MVAENCRVVAFVVSVAADVMELRFLCTAKNNEHDR